MTTYSTNYRLREPTVGADADVWGGYLNAVIAALDKLMGGVATTGSANAYVLTTGQTIAAYATGQRFRVIPNFTCSGASTLNVDAIGAKNIYKYSNGALGAVASGDIISGVPITLTYDGTQFVIDGGFTLDATLTALAALSWSSGNALVQFTAADTVSLTLTPSVTSITTSGQILAAAGSVSAPGISFSADTNTGIYSATGDEIDFTLGGALKLQLSGSSIIVGNATTGNFRAGDGSVSTPGFNFSNDTDCGFYRIGANNIGLALNGAKVIDYGTSVVAFVAAAQAQPPVSSETGGTLTATSKNSIVNLATAPTLDGNVFAAGNGIELYNNTGSNMTITQGSTGSPTQRLQGTTTTGNLTIPARGRAPVRFISATEWTVGGDAF